MIVRRKKCDGGIGIWRGGGGGGRYVGRSMRWGG